MSAGRILNVLFALSALGASAAQAQIAGPQRGAGNDIVTINLYGGGYQPTSDLTSGSDFGSSGTVGGSATMWLHRYVGVRANVLYARTDASPNVPDPLEGETPNI
ncbi:MAG TPA: hypothetical protein VK864_14640, partial [Longimicrobiales bacterium]|nr:hypothetical protein [Longimicrobiales bacterium]